MAQLRKEQAELSERVQTLEQEAQEQYDAFTAKEEVWYHQSLGLNLCLSMLSYHIAVALL